MSKIIETLKLEHRLFRRYLDLFDQEMKAFEAGRSPRYELLEALLDYFTTFPDEWHHRKEDLVYDVMVTRSDVARSALYDLRIEHERLGAGAKQFGEHIADLRLGSDLPMNVIVEAGKTYSRLLRRHMVKEDDVFFPMAERYLTLQDWRDIEQTVQSFRNDPELSARLDRIDGVAGSIESIAASERY